MSDYAFWCWYKRGGFFVFEQVMNENIYPELETIIKGPLSERYTNVCKISIPLSADCKNQNSQKKPLCIWDEKT